MIKRNIDFFLIEAMMSCLLFSSAVKAEDLDAKKTNNQFVFKVMPQVTFINPTALNKEVTYFNDSFKSAGYKNVDLPQCKNSDLLDFYLGYKLKENFDLGVSYSFTAINSKSASGTDAMGNNAQRVGSSSLSIIGIQANYYFYEQGNFKLGINPTIGYAQYNISGSITSPIYEADVSAKSSGLAYKLGIVSEYKLFDFFSIRGETGYLFADSGDLTVTSQNNLQQTVGQSYKQSDGSGNSVNSNLSGAYVGIGVIFNFSLF